MSSPKVKPYDELTRLGQLRRIRQLARTALDAYGLRGARLTFLRYFANITYWSSSFIQDDPARRAEHEAWRDENGAMLLRYLEQR